eukprot:2624621-Prymnesium_polylepis.1
MAAGTGRQGGGEAAIAATEALPPSSQLPRAHMHDSFPDAPRVRRALPTPQVLIKGSSEEGVLKAKALLDTLLNFKSPEVRLRSDLPLLSPR